MRVLEPSERGTENIRDRSGWLPIHHAAAFGHRAAAYQVMPLPDGIGSRTADGTTGLHLAARFGHGDLYVAFSELPSASMAADASGRTPPELFDVAVRTTNWIASGVASRTPDHDAPKLPLLDESPVVAIKFIPGYPGSRPMYGTHIVAVWSDGVVAFSTDLHAGQAPARFGVVDRARVERLLADLASVGLFAIENVRYSVVDGPDLVLSARSGERAARWQYWRPPWSLGAAPELQGCGEWDRVAAGTWELAWKLWIELLPEESWALPGGSTKLRGIAVGMDEGREAGR